MPGGTVTLVPEHGSQLTMILASAPDRSGGVGGWQAAERSRRRPGKWWQGSPDDTMTLECIIDQDEIPGPTVERRLRVLRDMGQPRDDTGGDPPTISLSGDIWPSDQNANWVMSDLKLGERLYYSDGTLRRQAVSVDLERFNAIDEITAVRVKSTRRKGKRRRRVIHAHTHDTLRSIALREMGATGGWKQIKQWNPRLRKLDPDTPIRHGTHVVIR